LREIQNEKPSFSFLFPKRRLIYPKLVQAERKIRVSERRHRTERSESGKEMKKITIKYLSILKNCCTFAIIINIQNNKI
jgi:hypothetical protein